MYLPKEITVLICEFMDVDHKLAGMWICPASARDCIRRCVIQNLPRTVWPGIAVHAPRFLSKRKLVEAVQEESTIVLHPKFKPDVHLYRVAMDSGCIKKYIRCLGNASAIAAVRSQT